MIRPIRIGLIAEGEAELGASVPYIKPEDGGKVIDRAREGALHTLIRRELEKIGCPDCEFVQRHPTDRESGLYTLRTGHSILQPKYLSQIVIAWKPEEVDIILIVVDADDIEVQRRKDLKIALQKIRDNHLDENDQVINDRSSGGLAIRIFETWLLADFGTVAKLLGIEIKKPDDLEELSTTKQILDKAISESDYLADDTSNQRPLQVRWDLATQIDLDTIKTNCPKGYATFVDDLVIASNIAVAKIQELSG
jgi:hypothetical protein